MSRDKGEDYVFTEEEIKKRRKFPKRNIVYLTILVIIQIACIVFAILFNPSPMDKVDDYSIYVSPKDDGSLDIEYKLRWTPLDDEPLSWVYIGIANPNYSVLEYSDNVLYVEPYYDNYGESHLEIYFKTIYIQGETVEFSFKINQKNMLCQQDGRLFYEFVPCWFNATPISHYSFNWKTSDKIIFSNATSQTVEWLSWEGAMEPGEYRKLNVEYSEFNAPTHFYQAFDDSGVNNDLKDEKIGAWVIAIVIIFIALIFEIHIFDCFVSYHRGRGFIRGYGHYMYIYGRRNRRYVDARDKHMASHGGGRHSGGGGCACACACACAGGGRAGCSQKDTYKINKTVGE